MREHGDRGAMRVIVLDSEGLSQTVLRGSRMTEWVTSAALDGTPVITSAATLVEVTHPRIKRPALDWVLSRVIVKPVSEEIARLASRLLADAGLHGHKHAIDAMLCATALQAPGPATILTSDPDDLTALCAGKAAVIKI